MGASLIQAAVAGAFRTMQVAVGDVIVQEGGRGNESFVLLSGAADVVVGGRRVNRIEAGELFGEIAPIDGGTRLATVIASVPSRVAVLDHPTTQDLLRHPEVGLGVAARLAGWLRRAQAPVVGTGGWATLTAAERRVAGLVTEGLTNRQIGARLHVSAYTVDSHLRHIFTKLAISSRVELAALAVRAGAPAA